MSVQVAIMFAVAAVFAVSGLGLLFALLRPAGPAKIYVFRMAGVMALALGVVLACSAGAMWRWGVAR